MEIEFIQLEWKLLRQAGGSTPLPHLLHFANFIDSIPQTALISFHLFFHIWLLDSYEIYKDIFVHKSLIIKFKCVDRTIKHITIAE